MNTTPNITVILTKLEDMVIGIVTRCFVLVFFFFSDLVQSAKFEFQKKKETQVKT